MPPCPHFLVPWVPDGAQVVPRLLERAAKASRLASASFGPLHSSPAQKGSSNGGRSGGGDMDVDESDAAGGGSGGGWGGRAGKGHHQRRPSDAGAESAEGVELLQVRHAVRHLPYGIWQQSHRLRW